MQRALGFIANLGSRGAVDMSQRTSRGLRPWYAVAALLQRVLSAVRDTDPGSLGNRMVGATAIGGKGLTAPTNCLISRVERPWHAGCSLG